MTWGSTLTRRRGTTLPSKARCASYPERAAATSGLLGSLSCGRPMIAAITIDRNRQTARPRFSSRAVRGLRLRAAGPVLVQGEGGVPELGGRRMAERAANLVEQVFPTVPVRQWVLTVPHRLRYRLAFDHALCRAVLGVFIRAVLGWYRRRGRRAGVPDGQSGTVTVVQRFGSGLELNVHFHTLGLDGVFAPGADGTLRFHRLPPPTDADVAGLVATIARRVGRLLVRRGLADDADAVDPLAAESPALAGLASAAVQGRVALEPRAGARVARLGADPDAPWVESSQPLQARCDGFDLHGGVTVAGEDWERLEQLCRYLLRPPIAQERLALRLDGTVLVTLKTPWRDGTTHLCFEPVTLLERLAALTPRPRINVVLYHGVLAPRARWRASAVTYGRAEAPATPNH